jgi:hypothetical protein
MPSLPPHSGKAGGAVGRCRHPCRGANRPKAARLRRGGAPGALGSGKRRPRPIRQTVRRRLTRGYCRRGERHCPRGVCRIEGPVRANRSAMRGATDQPVPARQRRAWRVPGRVRNPARPGRARGRPVSRAAPGILRPYPGAERVRQDGSGVEQERCRTTPPRP